MHPYCQEESKMESIITNYKKVSEIQEELKNVNIENYLEFNYQGDYVFKKCEYSDGPLLGHITQKFPRLDYDENAVKKFETHLKNIGVFSEAVKRRHKNHVEEVAKWSESKVVTVPAPAVAAGGTTQLPKPRLPPLWSGQKFDRWKVEVERWYENDKSSDVENILIY